MQWIDKNIEKSPCITNDLADHGEIRHGDAYCHVNDAYIPYRQLKYGLSNIQYGTLVIWYNQDLRFVMNNYFFCPVMIPPLNCAYMFLSIKGIF